MPFCIHDPNAALVKKKKQTKGLPESKDMLVFSDQHDDRLSSMFVDNASLWVSVR